MSEPFQLSLPLSYRCDYCGEPEAKDHDLPGNVMASILRSIRLPGGVVDVARGRLRTCWSCGRREIRYVIPEGKEEVVIQIPPGVLRDGGT